MANQRIINFKQLEDSLFELGYARNPFFTGDTIAVPNMTSYQFLMHNIKKFDGITAMTFVGNKISYEVFAKYIDKTADAMKGLSLCDRDRVGVLLPNIPEAAYMQYGPSKLGISVSNIDPRTNSETLLKYVKKEKLKAIIVAEELYELTIRPIERQLKDNYKITQIIIVPSANSLPLALKGIKKIADLKKGKRRLTSDILGIVYWNDLLESTRYQHAIDVGYSPDKEALVQHSSGTSGQPKSIPLTNENINMFVEGHRPTEFGELRPGTRMLHILPYFAAYGAVNSAHLGFNFGFTMQEIPVFNFKNFGYIAYKNKSEVVIGVPNWFNAASKDPRLNGKDMSHILMAISGGAKNSIAGKKEDDDFLKKVHAKCIETNGHGMSEICGSGSYQFRNHQNGLGIGIPFPYVKYIIVDNNGNIVPMTENGIEGEAYIYSPSATTGTFEGERFAQTKEFFGFTFINSKDTIRINPNYEMFFSDREDRQFARFDGHKIVPAEIEHKISESSAIRNAIVVPYYDDENTGLMPIAYVIPDEKLSEDRYVGVIKSIVVDFLSSSHVTSREIPKKFKFISKFPQNAMGKNDYKALEARKLDNTEYTVIMKENNLSVEGYSVIGSE